ncbi:MAG: carboxysome shell carbonic anhydrase, partial [Thiobacillus sp.]
MNTRKRLAAMRTAGVLEQPVALDNPACIVGAGQRCEHALVDPEQNQRLFAYEATVRGRFSSIVDALKVLSAMQHESDFVERAQRVAQDRLGYALPMALLEKAWVTGLDLRALYSHCIFNSFKACVDHADADQLPWRQRMVLDAAYIQSCGYHTVDISPCADGRLQGLLPFVFRMAPNAAVSVKAYAGVLFDVEGDVADWTHRELERLAGFIPGGEAGNYLKIAVYHYSTSNPCQQGCAAHGSNDALATQEAADRLAELRAAIENTFGRGAAPDTLLIGMDTDTDAIRVHVPARDGTTDLERWLDARQAYDDTQALTPEAARHKLLSLVRQAAPGEPDDGMVALVARLL